MAKMGFAFGLESGKYCKRQFRWIFEIPDVVADETAAQRGIDALPPEKAARPSLAFKEMDVKHLTEDVFYPAKPEWKPVTITVWDLATASNPVFEWVKYFYNPQSGILTEPNTKRNANNQSLFRNCYLKMLNGCGTEVLETWVWEDAWPQAVNFQTLDMTANGITMCDITLRYARAYIL
jgi:hypothetical protein